MDSKKKKSLENYASPIRLKNYAAHLPRYRNRVALRTSDVVRDRENNSSSTNAREATSSDRESENSVSTVHRHF